MVDDSRILDAAAEVLARDPTASLTQVARAAGLGRTSVHTRFPSRAALLGALAHDAMDRIDAVYAGCGLDDDDPPEETFRRIAAAMVPLGPRVMFLLREPSLDQVADIQERYETLDDPLRGYVERAQARGLVAEDLPSWWVTGIAFAAVQAAWEAIADGWLAPRAAPDLVVRTLLRGVGASPARSS